MIAKALFAVFIGIFTAATFYELIKKSYPAFMQKIEKKAKKKIDKVIDDDPSN